MKWSKWKTAAVIAAAVVVVTALKKVSSGSKPALPEASTVDVTLEGQATESVAEMVDSTRVRPHG